MTYRSVNMLLEPYAMGDIISAMPVIDYYSKDNNVHVNLTITAPYEFMFIESYPNITFGGYDYYDYTLNYLEFYKPMQHGWATQLGYDNWLYIRPMVDRPKSSRQIKNKYVSIGIHSTAQSKYWNHVSGIKSQEHSPNWESLCKLLRKDNITPVLIERDETFGVPPYYNGSPKSSNKIIGKPLTDVINYLYHAEFHIGISSGLSWLAHALGKPVAMISNFTEEWNEFDINLDDYIRITNKDVCHGCWNKCGVIYNFDAGDWYWCPEHKGTDRQFECHTSITVDVVYDKLKKWIINE